MARRLFAELIGTLLLVCTVVGSGIMADALSPDDAVALLGNTIPTGAMLFLLITLLGPLSGAHFNPAVSLVMALRGILNWRDLVPYAAVQVLGAIMGTLVALYIAAAYWFTASTSFANPAVTIGRTLTDTFAGIDPAHVGAFIVAQLLGALAAMVQAGWLFGKD